MNNISMDFQEVRQFLYTQVNALCQKKHIQVLNLPLANQSIEKAIYTLVVHTYNSLLKHPLNQKVYLQNPNYVISKKLKQLGQVASVLANYIFQDGSEMQQLASFQTTNFMSSNNQNYKQIIRIAKGIYPLTNLHKDNIPLYVPFREQLNNYGKFGNSNWELSRDILQRYKKTVQKQNQVLQNRKEDKQIQSQIEQNLKLEMVIQMLLGSTQLFQKAKNKNKIEMIWSYSYINYIKSTLSPYSRSKLKLIDINQLLQEKQVIPNNQTQEQINIQQVLLSNLAMFNITNQLEYFIRFFNQFLTIIELNKQKLKLLLLPICNSIIYSILNLLIQQHKDSQQFQTDLNEMVKHTLKYKDEFIQTRTLFWGESLPVFYNNQNQRENGMRKQNQLIQVLKQVIEEDLQRCYPFYPYFTRKMNQQISKHYVKIMPKCMMNVIKFLPRDFVVNQLFKNQQILQDQRSCSTVIAYLQNESNRVKLQKQIIKELEIQQVKSDYNYFIQCWKSYHKLVNSPQFKSENLNYDKQQKVLDQINTLLSLSNHEVLPRFRSIMHLPFDNNNIVFKILKNYFQGVSWIVLNDSQVNLSKYLQFMQSQNFRYKLMLNMEGQQVDQLWKILGYILLNHKETFQQLSNNQNIIQGSKTNLVLEKNIKENNQESNRMILQD